MCWAAIIMGRIILHWFDTNTAANQKVHLKMLHFSRGLKSEAQAPKINSGFNRMVLLPTLLNKCGSGVKVETKLQGIIISRYASILWPDRSPDFSPLDYWFCSHCTERVTRDGPE